MAKLNEIKWLKDEDPDYIIDPLTQIINRKFILKIANGLVEDKIPFALMILDLDNFKQINDSYGHLAGDFILKSIGEALVNYYSKEIFIGRYGGDEILLLIPNLVNYEDVHSFLEGLYTKDKVLRKYYNDGTRDIYLTASLGCATYPNDASNFEDLFSKADKALYRGKTKGRNCYIIYVEEKHKDIVVREKSEGSLIEHFKSATRIFDIYRDKKYIKHMMDFLYSELHCSGAYFLTSNDEIISFKDEKAIKTNVDYKPHLEGLLRGDSIFYQTPLSKFKQNDKKLRDFLEKRSIQSVLIVKLDTFGIFNGYIMICEKEITRVWQESEIALVMYAASLLELKLKID
ncbi:MAG: GGDEF domain-containing protein [Acholeplasmatales bacterium]|nr:GGDEF domain-containing protein [Acholeplasmatales bacterium]